MKKVLVACETIEDEVNSALDRLKLNYKVIWLEGGLHNSPARLRARLQTTLNEIDGQCDQLIFTLGYCGGGVSELTCGNYTTILPLADDCLSVLLGSMSARKKASSPYTYFLTKGWMQHENNVVTSYERSVEKYGESRADRINKMMLQNYERFGLIDTGSYDLQTAADKVDYLSKKLNLPVETLPSDLNWLETLFTGPYDDASKFLILPPHSELNFDQWSAILEVP